MAKNSAFQELGDVPIGDMVQALAIGIAEAQFQLDRASARLAEMMSGTYQLRSDLDSVLDDVPENDGLIDTRIWFNGEKLSMLELGFTPTFYQFVDTTLEVKVSVSVTRETTSETTSESTSTHTKKKKHGFFGSGGSTTSTRTTTVSARFAQRFQYSAEGASVIRTKMVPVPPPAILEDRIRELYQSSEPRRAAAESEKEVAD